MIFQCCGFNKSEQVPFIPSSPEKGKYKTTLGMDQEVFWVIVYHRICSVVRRSGREWSREIMYAQRIFDKNICYVFSYYFSILTYIFLIGPNAQ